MNKQCSIVCQSSVNTLRLLAYIAVQQEVYVKIKEEDNIADYIARINKSLCPIYYTDIELKSILGNIKFVDKLDVTYQVISFSIYASSEIVLPSAFLLVGNRSIRMIIDFDHGYIPVIYGITLETESLLHLKSVKMFENINVKYLL